MKRKNSSVLGVLMAVLMALTVLAACEKTPAGAENSGGSGESVSESSESGAQTSTEGENSGDNGAQTSTEVENSVPFLTFEKEKELWSSYSEK